MVADNYNGVSFLCTCISIPMLVPCSGNTYNLKTLVLFKVLTTIPLLGTHKLFFGNLSVLYLCRSWPFFREGW